MAAAPLVILTRPEHAARRFAALLEPALAGRAEVLIAPILDIVPEPMEGDFSQYQTLIFTSSNAVAMLAGRSDLAGKPAFCVGDRTAEEAAQAGFDAVSAGGDAAALETKLLDAPPPGPWLHPTGTHQRVDLARRLTEAGHRTDSVVVYRQEGRPLSVAALNALRERETVLPVFSPRSSALLSEALPRGAVPPLVVAISAAAANAWAAPAHDIRVAPNPDAASVAATIRAALDPDSAC